MAGVLSAVGLGGKAPFVGPRMPRNQQWVDMQVEVARRQDSGILWMDQAFLNPLYLYKQWRTFNEVFPNKRVVVDTWLKCGGVGVVLFFFMLYLWTFLRPVEAGPMYLLWNGAISTFCGVGGFYALGVWLMFRQCYVKMLVMGRYNFINPGQCDDILICNVPRLALANRPDVFVGNNGRNGIRDVQSYVRLKTEFGVFVYDISSTMECYDLPKDEDGMQFGAASTRYDLYRMAEQLGTLVAAFHENPGKEAVAEFINNNMPWFVSGGAMLVGLFILLQLFD